MNYEMFLYDDTVQSKTRFVSFMGENARYDFCLMYTDRFFGKTIVMNMQSSRFAIIGPKDLDEPDYIMSSLSLQEEEVEEVCNFLMDVV